MVVLVYVDTLKNYCGYLLFYYNQGAHVWRFYLFFSRNWKNKLLQQIGTYLNMKGQNGKVKIYLINADA